MKALIENRIITEILNDGCGVLTIPKNATAIDESAMITGMPDGLEEIRIEDGNTHFSSTHGCLIHNDTKTLVIATNGCQVPDDGSVEVIGVCAFGGNTENETVVLPDGVRFLEIGSFANSAVRRIVLPASVEYVAGNSFGVCPNLEEIIVLGKNTVFALSAFAKLQNDGTQMPKVFGNFLNPNLVIKGNAGSSASDCAMKNGIRFEELCEE